MISLTKNQKINLTKDNGEGLEQVYFGVNWGMVQSKGFFGAVKTKSVDLDASAILLDSNNEEVSTVYYGRPKAKGVSHSGDDRSGDDRPDDLDNEVISINLSQLDERVTKVGLVLNSFNHIDFNDLPYAGCRIFEGTSSECPTNVIAGYQIAHESKFKGRVAMILGSFEKIDGKWTFRAIGEPTNDRKLGKLFENYANNFA